MTATIKPGVASVTCAKCGEWFEMPRSQLSSNDQRFLCPKHAPADPEPRAAKTSTRGELSKADAILTAMLREEHDRGEGCHLTQTELIKASWVVDRYGFGLRGDADRYPCSNRVIVEVVKLVRQGLIDRVGVCLYRLTDRGRWRIRRLHKEQAKKGQ